MMYQILFSFIALVANIAHAMEEEPKPTMYYVQSSDNPEELLTLSDDLVNHFPALKSAFSCDEQKSQLKIINLPLSHKNTVEFIDLIRKNYVWDLVHNLSWKHNSTALKTQLPNATELILFDELEAMKLGNESSDYLSLSHKLKANPLARALVGYIAKHSNPASIEQFGKKIYKTMPAYCDTFFNKNTIQKYPEKISTLFVKAACKQLISKEFFGQLIADAAKKQTLKNMSNYIVDQLHNGKKYQQLISLLDDSNPNLYKMCTLIRSNIIPSTAAAQHELKGHTGLVQALALLSTNQFASGSNDKSIRIWNSDSGTCEKILSGHDGSVTALATLSAAKLASGSTDKTLKIWNTNTGECKQTLEGHKSQILSVDALDERLVSSSLDASVRVWNLNDGSCLYTLFPDAVMIKPVYHKVIAFENGFASGSNRGDLCIWNTILDAHKPIAQKKYYDGITDLQRIDNNHIAVGFNDGDIQIVDDNGEFVANRPYAKNKSRVVATAKLSGGRIISAYQDNCVSICDNDQELHSFSLPLPCKSMINVQNGIVAFAQENDIVLRYDPQFCSTKELITTFEQKRILEEAMNPFARFKK